MSKNIPCFLLPLARPRIPVAISLTNTPPPLPHKYLITATYVRHISTRSPSSPRLLQVQNHRTKLYAPRSTIISSSTSTQLPTISSIFTYFFGSSTPTEAMSNAKAKAENIIKENAVVVFSKSYCPFCRSTKELLNETGASVFTMELDEADDGPAIQDALQDITGQRTVPNIFINHKHIGGNSELQARKTELPALLKEAGAV